MARESNRTAVVLIASSLFLAAGLCANAGCGSSDDTNSVPIAASGGAAGNGDAAAKGGASPDGSAGTGGSKPDASSGGSAGKGGSAGTIGTGGSAAGNIIPAQSCSAADVNAAIASAAPGDTVMIPAGSCIWGSTTATVYINKAITLTGSGTSSTLITASADTALSLDANQGVVSNFQILTDATSTTPTMLSIGSQSGWRITGMKLDGSNARYVLYLGGNVAETTETFGLIDANSFINLNGEQFFFRGPCNSWTAPHSLGGAANMFIENNTFTAKAGESSYADFNANTRAVVRFNTFDGLYLDAHGSWSNYDSCTPDYHESARHVEVYNNMFTGGVGWTTVYIRGGTGLVYNNVVDASVQWGFIFLDEYYVRTGHLNDATWMYYPSACACASDYPVVYQIGRGQTSSLPPASGAALAAEPMFLWNNTKGGAALNIDSNPYGGPSADCKTFCGDANLSVSTFVQEGREFCNHSTATACAGYDLTSYAPSHARTHGSVLAPATATQPG